MARRITCTGMRDCPIASHTVPCWAATLYAVIGAHPDVVDASHVRMSHAVWLARIAPSRVGREVAYPVKDRILLIRTGWYVLTRVDVVTPGRGQIPGVRTSTLDGRAWSFTAEGEDAAHRHYHDTKGKLDNGR